MTEDERIRENVKQILKERDREQDRRDREAFERLRTYFRLNFTDGASDAAFLKWCADMVKQAARKSKAMPIKEWDW